MIVRSLLVSVLVLGAAAQAVATTYTAGASCYGSAGPIQAGPSAQSQQCVVGSIPMPGIQTLGSAQGLQDASSSVGPTGIHLSSNSVLDVTGASSGNDQMYGQAWGIWEFDDFLVTGTGSASVPILGAMNLLVSGTVFANGMGDGQGPLTAYTNGLGQIYFEIEIDGQFAGNGQITYSSNDGSPIDFVDGLLIGYYGGGGSISDSITSSQLMIPVGQTFDVRVYVNASSSATVAISGMPADQFDRVNAIAGGGSDFSSTVRFPTSGPVFDLPVGYTLNSPSAGIVNNLLVPEPLRAGMLAVALAGLLLTAPGHRARGAR